jgi:FixJ family two-component response regulator
MAKKPMIAVVDDDEFVRKSVASLLRASGFAPEAFPNADAFLKSDAPRRAACLVADVHMPGMNGLELQSHLARAGNTVPTVLITASPDEDTRDRALKAGVISYLAKPFDDDELLECIELAIERGNS